MKHSKIIALEETCAGFRCEARSKVLEQTIALQKQLEDSEKARLEEWPLRFWKHVESHEGLREALPRWQFDKRLEETTRRQHEVSRTRLEDFQNWMTEADTYFITALEDSDNLFLQVLNQFIWTYTEGELQVLISEFQEENKKSLDNRLVGKEKHVHEVDLAAADDTITGPLFKIDFPR